MTFVLTIIQLIFGTILIVLILLQNRGGGLSGVFGGGDSGNIYRTKRGMEKGIFFSTIIFSILFLGISLANILLSVY